MISARTEKGREDIYLQIENCERKIKHLQDQKTMIEKKMRPLQELMHFLIRESNKQYKRINKHGNNKQNQ